MNTLAEFEQCYIKGDYPNSCWLWHVGTYHVKGYGMLHWEGRTEVAHRRSWILYRGPIPEGLWVLHNCPTGDDPECVNPDHLYLGDHDTNMRDMRLKGRSLTGERNTNGNLTEADVRYIRDKYATGLYTYEYIAKEFGIWQQSIARIITRQRWQHVK